MLTPYYGDSYASNVVYQCHCEETPLIDASQYGGSTTITGGVSLTTTKNSGVNGLLFNGSSGYLTLPSANLSLTGQFTIEMFVYGYDNSTCLFSKDANNYFYNNAFFILGTSIATSAIPNTSAYKHLSITRDASNVVRIYWDGSKVGEGTKAGTVNYNSLQVGRYAAGSNLYTGARLDDIRFTNSVARYTGATLTVPTTPKIHNLQRFDAMCPRNPLQVNQNVTKMARWL